MNDNVKFALQLLAVITVILIAVTPILYSSVGPYIAVKTTTEPTTLTFPHTETLVGVRTISNGTVLDIVEIHTTNVTTTVNLESTVYVDNITTTTTSFIP